MASLKVPSLQGSNKNKLIGTFRDADIYVRDALLLENDDWLNSSCMNFGLRILEDRSYPVFTDSIYFIDPSVMAFLRFQCDEEDLFEFGEQVRLSERSVIFCPINDVDGLNVDRTGSHWSLLIYWRAESVFQHWDSCGTANDRAARVTATALQSAMRSPHVVAYESMAQWMPRQTNGVDCGLYALGVAEMCLDVILETISKELTSAGDADKKEQTVDRHALLNDKDIQNQVLLRIKIEMMTKVTPALITQRRMDLYLRCLSLENPGINPEV